MTRLEAKRDFCKDRALTGEFPVCSNGKCSARSRSYKRVPIGASEEGLFKMLPYFAPPYGLWETLAAALNSRKPLTPERLEMLFGEKLGVNNVILLPSARAGISWGLRACCPTGMRVQCPVFTCSAVWEAVYRAGAELYGVDIGEGSFLMDAKSLRTRANGRHGLVVCEVFGHTYDLADLKQEGGAEPEVRIIDMAGGVLHKGLFTRLGTRDLAVISFGRGSKAMYCGWGGMAFTQNTGIAESVRDIRSAEIQSGSPLLFCERLFRLSLLNLLQTAIGSYMKYELRKAWVRRKRCLGKRGSTPPDERKFSVMGREFCSPTVRAERYLMAYNLEHMDDHIENRRELTSRYNRNLSGVDNLALPPDSGDVLSHYTIRVPSQSRSGIIADLEKAGIEVGQLFFFSTQMGEYRRFFPSSSLQMEYPNASRVTSEVINLPMHVHLTRFDVDWISESVRKATARVVDGSMGKKDERVA